MKYTRQQRSNFGKKLEDKLVKLLMFDVMIT